jgi:hypothetical protein
MGGAKVTKIRILRTCAVGESNVDRAIGDLMITKNPTIGLAAHAGQTDVRITAKADTEVEADALIASLEAEVRQRLGVAIYGVEKETVPEVIGQLLSKGKIKLGVIDTLTGGLLTRGLIDAGFRLYPQLACDPGPGLDQTGGAWAAHIPGGLGGAEKLSLEDEAFGSPGEN